MGIYAWKYLKNIVSRAKPCIFQGEGVIMIHSSHFEESFLYTSIKSTSQIIQNRTNTSNPARH